MKIYILVAALIFNAIQSFGQAAVDSLVNLGIRNHDQGNYEDAILLYKQALALSPKSSLVNYEMALTYMHMRDYENTIRHADVVIDQNGDLVLPAYLAKGSALDYLGKTKQSIKLFQNAIANFGDHYLLNYNLALDYYKVKEYNKGMDLLVKGIGTNQKHPGSHFLLGATMADLDKRVQSLLSLYYFLLLEPNTERSKTAYSLLVEQFGGNVRHEKDGQGDTKTFINLNAPDSEFGPADMMISLLQASKTLDENKNKTEAELFAVNTTSFFKTLGELKSGKYKGLWWDFYIPFFNKLAHSKHMDTYCNLIRQSADTNSAQSVRDNESKIQDLRAWLADE